MTKKFTVILLHYNQIDLIEEAIDSVINQSYNNIEFFIVDDGSKEFDEKKVKDLIDTKKRKISYQVLINKQNVGTVRSLNIALKKASGDYILFFASDDRLSNNKVIENFVKAFDKHKNTKVLSAQALMYESNFNSKSTPYVNCEEALVLNKENAKSQFKKMSLRCLYASGATAYRKEIFKDYGYPSEDYMLIEDITYWLHLLRFGEKIFYEDFQALDHRDGGVSKVTEKPSKAVLLYYKDLALMYEKQILPYIKEFNTNDQKQILSIYLNIIGYLRYHINGYFKNKRKQIYKLYIANPRYFLYKIKLKLKEFIKSLRYKRRSIARYIIWLILNALTISFLPLDKLLEIGTVVIINHLLAYVFTYFIPLIRRRVA